MCAIRAQVLRAGERRTSEGALGGSSCFAFACGWPRVAGWFERGIRRTWGRI